MKYRVVVVYSDPRGGTWRGPWETEAEANKRLAVEKKRAHGTVYLEYHGVLS